jgi:beta-alanine degradation protein BauB
MSMTMADKPAERAEQGGWAAEISAEYARERERPNGCVGTRLLSETERARVWEVRLAPGERLGFHRHVLDYFWTCVTGGRARAHHDGKIVEYTYEPGETRHESHAAGDYKVHDIENTGEKEIVFVTVEFLDSANEPLPVPDTRRPRP